MCDLPETRKVLRYFDDFPKKGIRFVDVNPIMYNPAALSEIVDVLIKRYSSDEYKIGAVAGLEARGYYFGIPLAVALKVPFIPLRKPGKLPGEVSTVSYGKEYGKDSINVQKGCIEEGMRVVIIDDLLATGGTLNAAIKLVKECGGVVVETMCVIELAALKGRAALPADVPFHSLIVEEHIE